MGSPPSVRCCRSGVSERELLQAAASAEQGSEHPLGRAIVRYAEQKNFPIPNPRLPLSGWPWHVAQVEGERVAVATALTFSPLGSNYLRESRHSTEHPSL